MMNLKGIHETFVKDLIDDIIEIGSAVSSNRSSKSDGTKNVTKMTSLARMSSALTATFPVVCSTSIEPELAGKITKAVERKGVNMLQIAFTAAQITNSSNALDYLRKFHTNLDDKASFDDFQAALDTLESLDESVYGYSNVKQISDASDVYRDCRNNLNYHFEDSIRETSLNDFSVATVNGVNIIKEHTATYKESLVKEAVDIKPEDIKTDDDYRKFRAQKDINTADRQQQKLDIDISNYEANKIAARLTPAEVKKSNEVNPTLMMINFRTVDGVRDSQAVIGVKAKLYPVQSDDMMNRIIGKYQDSHVLLNFIKATTRETSFVKDFLFAIDKAKLDAINNSKKPSTSIFKAMERRSLRGKIRKMMKSADSIKCISTIVISTEEAEYMKKYNHVDVMNPRVIIPIMEKLNILFFIVVDNTSETLHFFEDGQTNYEVYTADALDKESGDFGYKKIINLITKMAK